MDNISCVSTSKLDESVYVRPRKMLYTQNGLKREWHYIEAHDSVAILLHHIARDAFIFVRQFRPAIYINQAKECGCHSDGQIDACSMPKEAGLCYELCAGIIDKEIDPLKIAQSEILEECGYDVPLERIEQITRARGGVGLTGTYQIIYYATVTDEMKKGPGGGNPEEGEMIEVVELPVCDSLKFVMNTTVERPVGVIAAVMWYHMIKKGSVRTE